MMGTEFVKLVFGTLEFLSIVVISFALFRIQIRYNAVKITAIAIAVTLISLYQRDFLGIGENAVLAMIVSYIILVSLLFNVQMLFSAVICIFGYIAFALIQTVFVVIGTSSGLTTIETMKSSLAHGSALQLVSALATFAIVLWMSRRKLGFMFIQRRISFNASTRIQNIFLLVSLILGIGVMQLCLISFQENASLIYVLLALSVVSSIGLLVTYKKNKKEITEKYNKLKMKRYPH